MIGDLAPLILAGVPLMGAAVSSVLWSHPDRAKTWSIIVSVATFAALLLLSQFLLPPVEGWLLISLLPWAACASLLGQPIDETHRSAGILTLVLLGLGMAVLTDMGMIGQISLIVILGLTTVLLYRHHTPLWPMSWWAIGSYGLGAACAITALISGPPFSLLMSLLVCATLLPLIPFHDGYLAALTRLPGSLPSFLVLLLPAIGLHRLATVMPGIPDNAVLTMTVFALIGALYAAIKALAQSRVRLLLAYGSVSFFGILWFFVASTRTVTPHTAVFAGAAGLVTGGLLLAWQVIRTRYGDDVDPHAISGLASSMPHYAVLLSLLALAAMGLPPFGLFAGFMGLILASSFSSAAAWLVVFGAWLAASWYVLDLVQRLLFGPRRPDLRYDDLRRAEFASLLIVVLLSIGLGVAPAGLFGSDRSSYPATTVMKTSVWPR